jgi:hypothetical protein
VELEIFELLLLSTPNEQSEAKSLEARKYLMKLQRTLECKILSSHWRMILTKLDNDLAEVVWMSAPRKEPFIANCSPVLMLRSEDILLNIADTLHDQADGIQYHASYIPPSAKCRLRILRDIRRVQNSHRKRTSPYPDHLKDPKAQELEEVISFVVKAVIFAGFEDAE